LERDSTRGGIAKLRAWPVLWRKRSKTAGAGSSGSAALKPGRLMQIKGIANKLWMAAEAAVFLIFLAVSIQRDFAGFLVVMFCICCFVAYRWYVRSARP
jgi:hypothetical protein